MGSQNIFLLFFAEEFIAMFKQREYLSMSNKEKNTGLPARSIVHVVEAGKAPAELKDKTSEHAVDIEIALAEVEAGTLDELLRAKAKGKENLEKST
jgi:hypothetical protein